MVGVLGSTVVAKTSAGSGSDLLRAAKHRALLTALALRHGRPSTSEMLVTAI